MLVDFFFIRYYVACCRWGHVLLSSWLDIAEEKTIMYQAGSTQPLLQPLLAPAPAPAPTYVPPPPAYLPPLETIRDLAVGGVMAQGKGYQQITSWQVSQRTHHLLVQDSVSLSGSAQHIGMNSVGIPSQELHMQRSCSPHSPRIWSDFDCHRLFNNASNLSVHTIGGLSLSHNTVYKQSKLTCRLCTGT